MDDYIIYLEGDVSGKSTKAKGHKTITVQLSPTTVEAGVYSGRKEITVDKSGRVTNIKMIPEVDVLKEITSRDGILYTENGELKYISAEELLPKPQVIEYPVNTVNGKKGDVVIEIPEFKQEYKSGDYDISMISGVELSQGFLFSDGNKIFSKEIEHPKQPVFKLQGDVEGSGEETIDVKIKTVPVEKGGTGVETLEEAKTKLWPGELDSVTINTARGFVSVKNDAGKKFLTQEEGSLPKYSSITQQDLPEIPVEKVVGCTPVSKGGTGVTSFSKQGLVFVYGDRLESSSIKEEDILSLFDEIKKLNKKVQDLEVYSREIELRLGDEIKHLKKLI